MWWRRGSVSDRLMIKCIVRTVRIFPPTDYRLKWNNPYASFWATTGHCALSKKYYWNPTSLCRSFAADPDVPWVLIISRVPDAQVIPERFSHAHSRIPRPGGSLSTCAVLSLANQGHQGGAAKTLPETTSHGRLPQLRYTVPNQNTG